MKGIVIGGSIILVVAFILLGLARSNRSLPYVPPIPAPITKTDGSFELRSSAFEEGDAIPAAYTCDGANTHPPLSIRGVPKGTQSLAIVMHDPDAPGGSFVHWLAWNIAPETQEIPEGALAPGITEGTSGFRSVGYKGPCPPSGTHRYIWRLYALRTFLSLDSKSTLGELETAVNTYVISFTELIARYTR